MHYFGEKMHKTKVFLHKSDFSPFGMADSGGRGIGTETAGAVTRSVALCAHTSKMFFFFRKDAFFFS